MTSELTELWVSEYARYRGHTRHGTLLWSFQSEYLRQTAGDSFLELPGDNRFLRLFIHQPPFSVWSIHRQRPFMQSLKGFMAWLLAQGRIDRDVFFYTSVSEAVQGQVEPLVLRDDLQRSIAALEAQLKGQKPNGWVDGAHRYNRYRSRIGTPSDETECLLEWMRLVACAAPARSSRWLSGLSRVFELAGRTELRELLADCRSLAAVLRALAGDQKPPCEALQEARRPRFESGLARWLEDLIEHRAGRRMKIHSWPSELRRLDRIALRNGVQDPEQLTGAMLEEFLRSPTARTRNGRLSKLRSLARFLAPRGRRMDLSGWRTAPEPPFRPHLYTLQEIGLLLQAMQERGRVGRAFHWLGLETVVFLLYACGMRLREPLGLRVQDVCLEERALFLHCTKFYKQRWVPLGKGAWRRLTCYAEQRETQFPERGGGDEPFFLGDYGRAFSKGSLHNAFSSIRREIGLGSRGTRSEARLHDLRHTLAVHRLYQWYAEGVDVQNKLPLLSAYLGHDRLEHTEVYLHLTEDLIRQAGRGFQASFEEIVGPVVMRNADTP